MPAKRQELPIVRSEKVSFIPVCVLAEKMCSSSLLQRYAVCVMTSIATLLLFLSLVSNIQRKYSFLFSLL